MKELRACMILLSAVAAQGQTGLPYTTDFETAEGYTAGNFTGHGGWTLDQGAAAISTAEAQSGAQSLVLQGNTPFTQVSQVFSLLPGEDIYFTDFYVKPVALLVSSEDEFADEEGSMMGFFKIDGAGFLHVLHGDGALGGEWQATDFQTTLTGGDRPAGWLRITLRQDFASKKWDLFVNGELVAFDLGFFDDAATFPQTFVLMGAETADTSLDHFSIGISNPLFGDGDRDGLPDSWEDIYGLNPTSNDRESDPDGDQVSNVGEFSLGTHPIEEDTDDDGLNDGQELANGWDPTIHDRGAFILNYSSLELWLDGSRGVHTDGSGNVFDWQNLASTTNSATQPQVDNRPHWDLDPLTGKHTLVFDGINDYLILPSGFENFSNGLTLIIVAQLENANFWGRFFDLGNGQANNNILFARWEATPNLAYVIFHGGGWVSHLTAAGSLQLNQLGVFIADHEPNGALELRKDGNVVASGNVLLPQSVLRTSNYLGKSNWSDPYLKAKVFEALIFNESIEEVDLDKIEYYLRTKYGQLPIDDDFDNLLDSWEIEWFGGVSSQNAEGDPDGDGVINSLELKNGWNPLDFNEEGELLTIPGMKIWVNGDSGNAGIGTQVSQWLDIGPAGNNLTQSISGQQPQVNANGPNGHAAVHFDGGDWLHMPWGLMTGETEGEVFIVHRVDATRVNGLWRFNGYYDQQYPDAQGKIIEGFGVYYAFNSGAPAIGLSDFHIYNVAVGANFWKSKINGLDHFTQSAPHAPVFWTNDLQLGRSGDGLRLVGDVAELIMFDRKLTSEERTKVENFLLLKYGFVTDPPDAPFGLKGITLSSTQVGISWQGDSSSGGIQYVLERKSEGGEFAEIGQVTDIRFFLDASLAPAVTYVYRVRAENAAGASAFSSELTVVPPAHGGAPFPLGDLKTWLAADGGLVAGPISTWPDLSGNNNSALVLPVTGADKPTLVENVFNGLPAVHFDGSDWIHLPSGMMNGKAEGEVFIVHQVDTTRANGLWRFNGYWDQQYPNIHGHIIAGFGTYYAFDTGIPGVSLDVPHIYNVSAGPNHWKSRINYEDHYELTSHTVWWSSDLQLGRSGDGMRLVGDVAEVLIFDRKLTAEERNTVMFYLSRKFGFLFDADGDGLDKSWEIFYGFDPEDSADGGLDGDTDGLTNLEEFQLDLYPTNNDSDGDGMVDGWEVQHGFNAHQDDSQLDADGDGLTNVAEFLAGTDPQSLDTDGDSMPDGWEVIHGFNPISAADGGGDFDGDGLDNTEEFVHGSDPANPDSDSDGLTDGWEIAHFGNFSPSRYGDSDGDGLTHFREMNLGLDPNVIDVLGAVMNTPSLRLRLRADQGVKFDGLGGVEEWRDVSGNLHHTGQSDPGKRPAWVPTMTLRWSRILFDGVDDFLTGAMDFDPSVGDFTFIIYHTLVEQTDGSCLISFNTLSGDTGAPVLAWKATASDIGIFDAGVNETGLFHNFDPGPENRFLITIVSRNAGVLSLRTLEGGAAWESSATQSWTATSSNQFNLGRLLADSNSTYRGYISEVLVFASALTAQELAGIEAEMIQWHGLAAMEDTDHDSMPDYYEMIYFGNLDRDGDDDLDGDGISDFQEFLINTIPFWADHPDVGLRVLSSIL